MTNEEAKKMLEAKLKCLIAETSGTNYDCNMRLCDGCSLNYEQGNMGEQKQALDMAIKALEQPSVTAFADKCRECGKIFNDKLQMKWIPVSERLPEVGEKVLCQCQANIYEVLKLTADGWYHDKNHCYMLGFVVAWMPLPDMYEEDAE